MIGVDVGGTTVKGVVVDGDGRVVRELRRPTPAPDPTGAAVADTVAELVGVLDEGAGLPVGCVVPGIVDETRGIAVLSANIGWSDIAVAHMLRDRLGRAVAFGHDVRAGALAEARWGAARGTTGVVAFVPIGTGIAAALLVDGHPLVSGGWAGEIGQTLIRTGAHAGLRVEEVASAAGTARRAGVQDARTVAARVDAGDPEAQRVWRDTVEVLGDALANMTAAVAPETIVLGGGLALAGRTLTAPLESALDARLGLLRRPVLRTAELGDRAAALGAAILAIEAGV